MGNSLNRVGRYEIQYKVGSGTFGDVYKAYDPILKRVVAIKMPKITLEQDKLQKVIDEFYHEAAIGAQFQHDNIITVYDVGCNTISEIADSSGYNFHYLVMEYVSGVSLKDYMAQEGKLPLTEILSIVFECCKALDYIHYQGILHRDIKPGNIMVNPNFSTVKITDFSISDSMLNQVDKSIGTLPYTSPEHFDKKIKLSPQTDIFALGSVMFEMLTGLCPFRGGSVEDVMYKIIDAKPNTPLRELAPEVPEQVERIVAKAMQKRPQDRYDSALDFAHDVNDALVAWQSGGENEIVMDDRTMANIGEYLLLRKNSWFKDFSPKQIDELVRSGEVLAYKAGEAIITQGEQANDFYTIIEGETDVIKDGGIVNHLGTGECFGELSHLTASHKRAASVVATEPVRVLKANSELLERLSPESQASFYKAFLTVTMQRLLKQ